MPSLAADSLTPAPRTGLGARIGEFLAVGGLTPLLFPIAWALRKTLGLDFAELAVGFTMFHAAHLINDPHFAVTYLLFYQDLKSRAFGDAFPVALRVRYWFAAFLAPLGLAAWALTGLYLKSAPLLGLLIQLMFFTVGWHYTKQGFGVMVVLSARRGVRYSSRERLAILAHCFTGWAYAWTRKPFAGREMEEKGVIYQSLSRPDILATISKIAFFSSLIPLVGLLVQKRLREGKLAITTPLIAMLCSVWAWSIYSGADPLVRYVIPALHSIQYLYLVWLLKDGEARALEGPPTFETSARSRVFLLAAGALFLGWVLFHAAPSTLDDLLVSKKDRLTDLGPTPYFAALYAFVNLHHYFMDNVIWRRDNPRTQYLRAQATRPREDSTE
jgi:hypothetical protein